MKMREFYLANKSQLKQKHFLEIEALLTEHKKDTQKSALEKVSEIGDVYIR